jgi:hypothetical protein
MKFQCTFCGQIISENLHRLVWASFDAHVTSEHGKARPGLRLVRMPRPAAKPAK